MVAYAPSESVKFVLQQDGGMLLDLSNGRFYGLNPTSARLWNALIGGTSPEELAENLSAETGADLQTVKADVTRLVQDLCERGLLRPEGE